MYNIHQDNNFTFFGLAPQRIISVIDSLEKLLIADRPTCICCVRGGEGNLGGQKTKNALASTLAAIFGMSPEQLDPNLPFDVLGVDSLMGVEMRQVLERDFGIVKSVNELKKVFCNLRAISESINR